MHQTAFLMKNSLENFWSERLSDNSAKTLILVSGCLSKTYKNAQKSLFSGKRPFVGKEAQNKGRFLSVYSTKAENNIVALRITTHHTNW